MTKKIGSAHHSSAKKPKPVHSDDTPAFGRSKDLGYLQRPASSSPKQPATKTFAQRRTTPK